MRSGWRVLCVCLLLFLLAASSSFADDLEFIDAEEEDGDDSGGSPTWESAELLDGGEPLGSELGFPDFDSDLVVVTADGALHAFDIFGKPLWTHQVGHALVNATVGKERDGSLETWGGDSRMIPSMDGRMYIVSQVGEGVHMAFTNTTVVSVVAEAPFYSPAFPGVYISGSKYQEMYPLKFDENFTGWAEHAVPRYVGRELLLSLDNWVVDAIHTKSHAKKWSLSFSELKSFTHHHKNPGTLERFRIMNLQKTVRIVGPKTVTISHNPGTCGCPPPPPHRPGAPESPPVEVAMDLNFQGRHSPFSHGYDPRVFTSEKLVCSDEKAVIVLQFSEPILAVFGVLDPPDTDRKLAMVNVASTGPLPAQHGDWQVLLPDRSLATVSAHPSDDGNPSQFFSWPGPAPPPGRNRKNPMEGALVKGPRPGSVLSSKDLLSLEDADPFTRMLVRSWESREPGFGPSEDEVQNYKDFSAFMMPEPTTYGVTFVPLTAPLSLTLYQTFWKDKGVAWRTAVLTVLMGCLWFVYYACREIYEARRTKLIELARLAIEEREKLAALDTPRASCPNSQFFGQDHIVLAEWVPKKFAEMIQQEISRAFGSNTSLVKLCDGEGLSDKDPFTYPHENPKVNRTVTFGCTAAGERRIVFRNPLYEKEQRPNIPVFSQAVRNSVASFLLPEKLGGASIQAYVPPSCVCSWNNCEGVVQKFVKKSGDIDLELLKSSKQDMARDMALVFMVLRDTDGHDGNYFRGGLGGKSVILYDLGCSLADRPLAVNSEESEYLDNFDLWRHAPEIFEVEFSERQLEYLRNMDFEGAREAWKCFLYPDKLLSIVERNLMGAEDRPAPGSPLPSNGSSLSMLRKSVELGGRVLRKRLSELQAWLDPVVEEEQVRTRSESRLSGSGGLHTPKGRPSGNGKFPGLPPKSGSMSETSKSTCGKEEGEAELELPDRLQYSDLVHPLRMIKMAEIHRDFLLACGEKGKSLMWALKVVFTGRYDDLWHSLPNPSDLDAFGAALLKVIEE